MANVKVRITVLFASALLVAMLGLGGCGGSSAGGSSAGGESSAGVAAESSASETSAESDAQGEETEATGPGKPWLATFETGNLPSEVPDAKDDLYTHYNYDFIAAHQGEDITQLGSHQGELRDYVLANIKDESKTDHDLEQMRILFNQANDVETLEQVGLSELQPYLDQVDKANSIAELNEVLASEEFPFNPWIMPLLGVDNMKGQVIPYIYPNLYFVDGLTTGGEYYRDFESESGRAAIGNATFATQAAMNMDLGLLGMSEDEATVAVDAALGFEVVYGARAESPGRYRSADFGAYADSVSSSFYTLEQACALCPNIPLQGMLEKCGKGASSSYGIPSSEWLVALNDAWTDENLDLIKTFTKAKLLSETRLYRDRSAQKKMADDFAQANGVSDSGLPSDEETAFNACNSINTFSHLMAKTYVDDVLGQDAKGRLEGLTQDLLDAYKELVGDTTWMGEESRARVLEKLDHMSINMLEPDAGYIDYSGLDLVATEDGGTLLGNYLKCKQYRYDFEEKLIGEPAISSWAWYAITPTVPNAFYDAQSNSINVLPGIVTSNLYADDMSDSDLLGGIGFIIAHEISHGFDYEGAQLDAYGMPEPVFTGADVDAFVAKRAKLASYFDGIEVHEGEHVNGTAVSSEAVADLSGMQAVLQLAEQVEGIDWDAFFANMAALWAQVTPKDGYFMYFYDSHPLNYLRVNVNVQMFDTIYDAFGVSEGDGMYLAPEERIAIWGE